MSLPVGGAIAGTQRNDRPPTYRELAEQVASLTATLAIRERSIGSLQALIVAKDAELARAVRKKVPLIEMDPKASDKFRRRY